MKTFLGSKGSKGFIALYLIIIVSLAGCAKSGGESAGSSSSTGGSLRYGVTTEIDSLDTHKVAGGDAKGLLFNIYEGLAKPAEDGSLQPAVAESWTVEEDGKVYNFVIRKGVKFHNGKEVTAADVVFSLNRAKENKASGLDNIESVKADGNSVKITLTNADSGFVYSLAAVNAGIIPDGYEDGDKNPVGTGPFKFGSYTPQTSLVLKKNTEYWGTPAHLDEVTIVIQADSNTLALSILSGNIDAAGLSTSTAEQLDKSKFNVVERNSNAVQLIGLNNDYEPLRDVRVRQAINYAVNRDEIIQKAFSGYGTKVGTPIIPGLSVYFNSDLNNAYPFNVEKAKELLKEAGYENGFDLEITVPSNYTVHIDTAQVVVNQLAAVGINATIKQVEWATWLDKTYKQRLYQATIVSVGGASLSPRDELLRYVSTTGNNFYNYKSAEFDKAFEDAVAADTIELWKNAQKIISDEAANVFIQDIAGLTPLSKKFDGLRSFPVYGFIDFSTIYTVNG